MLPKVVSALMLMASVVWGQSEPVPLGAINEARTSRGLPPFAESPTLDEEAHDFLFYQLANGDISHEAAPEPERDILHEMYVAKFADEVGIPPTSWRMYELLAECECQLNVTELAHVFDDSPVHAEVFYDPGAEWIGYELYFSDNKWYWVVYVVVSNSGT